MRCCLAVPRSNDCQTVADTRRVVGSCWLCGAHRARAAAVALRGCGRKLSCIGMRGCGRKLKGVDENSWQSITRKRENWSRGPTVDDFCAGTHGCRPKSRGPTVDPGLTFDLISHPNSSLSPARASLGGGVMSCVRGPCNSVSANGTTKESNNLESNSSLSTAHTRDPEETFHDPPPSSLLLESDKGLRRVHPVQLHPVRRQHCTLHSTA
jgi:hypothetical protein